MSRFAGRSGEKRFSALCSDEGVTCNPAQEDDHGWDHVVQFPHKTQAFVPADLQRSLPAIFVQTKTQTSETSSVRMKLSNALALARSPNPCFVVVPPAKQGGDQRWRSFHFWDQAIEQALKRAREATSAGVPEDQLHKRWITFKLTEADWRDEDDLLHWIEQTVRETAFDYAQSKTSLLNSLGFDPERFVGTVEVGPMKSIEELVDHQLGLTPTIPIGKFELRDRRFGIEVNVPLPTGPGWIGTIHSLPKKCQLRLRGPDATELELESDFIVGSLPGLPVEQCKFRVKSDFVDFVMSGAGETRFNVKFNTADKRPPSDLEKLTRILSWAGQGPIDVQVWMEDKRLFGGTADINAGPERAAFRRLNLLIGPLVDLSLHLRVTAPAISIENVDAADNLLVALHGFLTTPDMNVEATFDAEFAPIEADQVLTYGFADVGIWRFGAITRWKLNDQVVHGGIWQFKLTHRKIVERYAFEAADAAALGAFQGDFQRLGTAPRTLVMNDDAVSRLCQAANA